MRSRARAWSAVAAGLVLVVLVVLAVPVGAGALGVAQLVSFRAVLALGALVLAAALVAVPTTRRRLRPLVAVLAVGALAQVAVLVWRSVPLPAAPTQADDEVVELAFNTLDTVGPQELARLVLDQDADVVVLPETSRTTADGVALLLRAAGRPVLVHAADSDVRGIAGTSLLVAADLGVYPDAQVLPTRLGSLRAEPADGGPVLVAAHPAAPITPGSMTTWRTETALVVAQCASTPGAIVAGDLNATLDHPALRDLGQCVDAARAAGAGARGTWPSTVPSLLAAPIDHVLVDGRSWRVTGFEVLGRTGASDHRPVVARLVRR
ncbi:endonuclease/exonuclease/phosphatase family protein [Cellulomonas fimi]|uniref:Endonuclease/exonuclease/phosphatase n=1 Tax=Cellulomonas fimi (strain ATCC 484 / DSM 20113 / JCM 1341 / CCUG 24087 / LMG 16345 / NBRC 15513 / NCIMB 8980 / NCTC 7547 / NRS-133) TaxID=590998 RepID=F4H272_CELFA|nr:endonuclease/exonuclease/phosphatase family protein [Cellulomonas fimi]AEE46369.1 Endonuclease/exonuclease/phosphatase [Cellulomonas fimi ATCC 484]NNH07169.1 endonuclease/exonuclease/phosphatase family protein [Cellulomonas fimi]VEH32716.1 Uncharacterized protein conserved in bacteria [Cellulomonas fimi]